MPSLRNTIQLALLAAPVILASSCQIAPKQSDAAKYNQEIEAAVLKISGENPKLASLFDTAYGYTIFPIVGEGGLLIASGFGRGSVFEEGHLIGYARVDEHSIGAVLGGEKWTLLIFFQDKAALSTFTEGKFAWNAKANAVAGTAGSAVGSNYSDGVIVVRVDPAGLMGNASAGFSNYKYLSLAET